MQLLYAIFDNLEEEDLEEHLRRKNCLNKC